VYIHFENTEGSTTSATSILLHNLEDSVDDNKDLLVLTFEFLAIIFVEEIGFVTEYKVEICSFTDHMLLRNTKY
jgi:hypothetical protein